MDEHLEIWNEHICIVKIGYFVLTQPFSMRTSYNNKVIENQLSFFFLLGFLLGFFAVSGDSKVSCFLSKLVGFCFRFGFVVLAMCVEPTQYVLCFIAAELFQYCNSAGGDSQVSCFLSKVFWFCFKSGFVVIAHGGILASLAPSVAGEIGKTARNNIFPMNQLNNGFVVAASSATAL